MAADWNAIESAASESLVNSLGMVCPFEPQEKQALLEARDLAQRAKVLVALIELASAQAYGGPKPPLQ
jgi:Lon protease-like protein